VLRHDAMDQYLNSRQLKILMVAPQPFFRARGTPFSVLHRIRALCSAGHTVDLVTYPFGEDIEISGLSIHRAGKPPFISDVKIGPSVAKLALDVPIYFKTRTLLKNGSYDLIHSHEEAAFFCVGLSREFALPHVYDMHSSLPQQLDTFGSYNLAPIRRLFKYLEDRVLSSCVGVITICQDLADTAVQSCGDTPHAMIENTADDREAFAKSDTDVRAMLGLEGKVVILYTGTFESYQGLDILMNAMEILLSRCPIAHLVMVGGRPEQVERFKKIVGKLGISDNVSFTGTIPPSQIPSFQDSADMIVSPRSSGTNSPLKLYGYLRSGRPLVATNMYTHTQVLDEDVALLVAPTPEGLAAGMQQLIDNPELAKTLGANAVQRADKEYSDRAYIEKVVSFYEKVLRYRSDTLDSAPQQVN